MNKVFYFVPWSSDKNIGVSYNECAILCPDDAYICFMDADTIPCIPNYGKLIEDVIERYPDVDAFTCSTNRVARMWQIAKGVDWQNDDMRYHRKIGEIRYNKFGSTCRDVTDYQYFSGLFLVIKKSAWDKIGGAADHGMLGVDNDIHRKLQENGMKLYQMLGLYLYHWYRGGNKRDTSHLQ